MLLTVKIRSHIVKLLEIFARSGVLRLLHERLVDDAHSVREGADNLERDRRVFFDKRDVLLPLDCDANDIGYGDARLALGAFCHARDNAHKVTGSQDNRLCALNIALIGDFHMPALNNVKTVSIFLAFNQNIHIFLKIYK